MFSTLQSWVQSLTADPVGFLIEMAYTVVAVLISLILHECAHGYVAYRCGDPTAKMLGRLTLDPRKHLDPIGTVCMFLLGFGWAKPVPVNPRNFQNYRRDDFLVSIAGIVTNLTLFLLCAALSVGLNRVMVGSEWYASMGTTAEGREMLYYSFAGSVLSGQIPEDIAQMMAMPWLQYVQRFLLMMMMMNLCLAVFNFLPIPPLDGYHILNDVILRGRLRLNESTFRAAQLILMLLCLSGALDGILSAAEDAVMTAVIHLFTLL